MSTTAVGAPSKGALDGATWDARRQSLKLPLRGLAAAGVIVASVALSVSIAAVTSESPLGPVAQRTEHVEQAQSIALSMPPPVQGAWNADAEPLLPVTDPAPPCPVPPHGPPAC